MTSLRQCTDVCENNTKILRAEDLYTIFGNSQEFLLLKIFIEIREDGRHLAESSDEWCHRTRLSGEEEVGNTSRNRLSVDSLCNTTCKIVRHVDIETCDVKSELESRNEPLARHVTPLRNWRQQIDCVRRILESVGDTWVNDSSKVPHWNVRLAESVFSEEEILDSHRLTRARTNPTVLSRID